MKVRDLLKNAIVLHSGGSADAGMKLPSLLREIEFKNLSSLGAYLLAQIDNEIDPVVQKIREAGAQEASGRPALMDSIKGMSAFNKVLNGRYGLPNSILLNVDDPALAEVIASLPHGILRYQPVQNPTLPRIGALISREVGLSSYLESMVSYVRERHAYNKAVSETLNEQSRGERFSVFAKMTFLRREKTSTFPHATLVRPREGVSLSLLRFTPDDEREGSSQWHGQELTRTFLFSHELGHCVMPAETHDLHFYWLRDKQDEVIREWMDEVYADVYSALFVARLTGNWDFLPLCLLPERSCESPDHNTFHCLRKLPGMVTAAEVVKLGERDLAGAAHNLVRELLTTEASPESLRIQDCASSLYLWSKRNPAGTALEFEQELDRLAGNCRDSNFRMMVIHSHAQRIQADIDALGIKLQLGATTEARRKSLLEISGVLRMAGHDSAATHVADLAASRSQDVSNRFTRLMSESAIQAADRYEETMMAIHDFWIEWQKEERGFQPKTKSPAFEGRAYG